MKRYEVKFTCEELPKYIQIEAHIKNLIEKNEIEDGEKLPSIRGLAKFLKVNNDTIVNAYKKLQQEGFAHQKMGSGTFAKKKEQNRSFKKIYSEAFKKISREELKGYIDFSGETTSSSFFPVEIFKKVLNEVLDRDGAEALVYQEMLGYSGLRRSINNAFWKASLNEDDILIVSGAQQGIDIISKAIINVNDSIVVEKPTYGGALSVFKGRRANIFEVEVEEDGIDIIQLEKILKKNKIKCLYLMSYFQNPTGMSYSLKKKNRILELAEKYDFFIIEDDYLSELIYDKEIEYKSFKSLDVQDRVIYIKSFSKIFLPGIRIGYLISPLRFKETIQNAKMNTDIATSSLMQRALELYINNGYWVEHIKNLDRIYGERYHIMRENLKGKLQGLVECFYPGGGFNFYIRLLPEIKINSIDLFYICKKNNLLLTPGVLFYKNYVDGLRYFRIGFSQSNEEQIIKGMEILKKILEENS